MNYQPIPITEADKCRRGDWESTSIKLNGLRRQILSCVSCLTACHLLGETPAWEGIALSGVLNKNLVPNRVTCGNRGSP